MLTFVAVACGNPVSTPSQVPLAAQAPVQQSLEDQRILLAPIAVDLGGVLPSPNPAEAKAPSASGELHQANDLAIVVKEGSKDLRDCVQEVQSGAAGVDLSGDLRLSLEVDARGQVLGGATVPAGGEAGLAALADCVLARARQWKFPSRTTPGSTVLIVPFQMH